MSNSFYPFGSAIFPKLLQERIWKNFDSIKETLKEILCQKALNETKEVIHCGILYNSESPLFKSPKKKLSVNEYERNCYISEFFKSGSG